MTPASFDGTTGRSRHAGRRTHVLQLLRDAPRAVSVRDVAATAGIPTATARYHLEAFVDAGLAERTTAPRRGPGRPEVVYSGTLPNQTHERAQGFRVLAATLTGVLGSQGAAGERTAYRVGQDWASRVLLGPAGGDGSTPEGDLVPALVAKLDALWFAPEVVEADPAAGVAPDGTRAVYRASTDDADPATAGCDVENAEIALLVNNCPLAAPDGTCPTATCHLEAGFIDGLLERLGSPDHRVVEIVPKHPMDHCCTMRIGRPGHIGRPGRIAPLDATEPAHHPVPADQVHGFAQLRASAPRRA